MRLFRYNSNPWRDALLALALLALACATEETTPQRPQDVDEAPRRGGRLVTAARAEPSTLNPVTAVDRISRLVSELTMADLVHINRQTQEVEPALAESWAISDDGLVYTLRLREGLRFSDGETLDADDVLFSYRVYLDEELAPPGREMLIVGGRPIEPRKVDARTVEFEMAEPYAVGLRLFDSRWILPRHLLEDAYREGRIGDAWSLGTEPAQMAGLGPFRFRKYESGQRLVLERNPHYWKRGPAGDALPYLDELVMLFVPSEDAQVIKFQAGETDVIERLNPSNFTALERSTDDAAYSLQDLGPGLSFVFMVFNLNDLDGQGLDALRTKQTWFRQLAFRQAVSAAVDRSQVVRLAYGGRATPLWSHVSPGYRFWFNRDLPRPARSLERARELLRQAGFRWTGEKLHDAGGRSVEFSIITSSSNTQRQRAATLLQEDLRQLGMKVTVVPLEQRALIDRLLNRRDYEACVLELGGGDADPNPQINILMSSGELHLWRLGQEQPATSWEAEIDRLMRAQLTTMDVTERKRKFDRVQLLMAENQAFIFLASPHILAGGKKNLGGFRPAVLSPHTLWNADELHWRERAG